MNRIVTALFFLAFAAPALAQTDKLGAGDAIRVTVFGQPDLTTEARVSERGSINMPLAGEVKIAGRSPSEAARDIAGKLKEGKFLKNPQVTVAITTVRSRQVSLLGHVARPGRYALDDTSDKLADVIAAAGGIAPTGSQTVTVIRDGKELKVDVFKPFALKGGETINVTPAPVFYIYGEVARGGAYPIVPDMTVMQAIAAGGGMTPRGSDRRLKLRRPAGEGKYVETDVKLDDRIKANDVIFVKESLF
jgi:polysaccharide export outer membrane protein